MANYSVWHNKQPNFSDLYRLDFNGANFEHVAHVEANSLEEVFVKTNHHMHYDWMHEEGVRAKSGSHRSTSVGDIIIDPEGMPHWVCKVGFESFSK